MILCVFFNYHIICPFSAAQIRFPAKQERNFILKYLFHAHVYPLFMFYSHTHNCFIAVVSRSDKET